MPKNPILFEVQAWNHNLKKMARILDLRDRIWRNLELEIETFRPVFGKILFSSYLIFKSES